jgi:chloramphenicol-sensitive protein RarD
MCVATVWLGVKNLAVLGIADLFVAPFEAATPVPAQSTTVNDEAGQRLGLILAGGTYAFWSLTTLYWHALNTVPLVEIVGYRSLWSAVTVALLLWWTGRLGDVLQAVRNRRTLILLAASGLMLFANWSIFIWAVGWFSVLEASLGYFINPLMSVAIGAVMLGERLNRAQLTAVGLATVAVIVQGLTLGHFPIVALAIGATFAIYGYLRKTINVPAVAGLFVESVVQLPLALLFLGWYAWHADGTQAMSMATMLLLAGSGLITAVPLITFAMAARRLPMLTMGLMQYIVPSGQFLLAILWFGEALSPMRLATFALIWAGLVIFTLDAWRRTQNQMPGTR